MIGRGSTAEVFEYDAKKRISCDEMLNELVRLQIQYLLPQTKRVLSYKDFLIGMVKNKTKKEKTLIYATVMLPE